MVNEADHESTKALVALCRTSRNLCCVAQPVLYHAPEIRKPGPFLRTIAVRRPDLAAEVRCLPRMLPWANTGDPIRMRKEDARLVRRLAKGLEMFVPPDGRFRVDAPESLPLSRCDEALYMGVLICSLPLLETLSLNVYEKIRIYFSNRGHYKLGRFHPELQTGSLAFPQLRTVVVNGKDLDSYFPWEIRGVVALLAAAPNLKELILSRIAGLDPRMMHQDTLNLLSTAIQSVTDVTMENFTLLSGNRPFPRERYESIRELVRLCPNMKAFGLRANPLWESSGFWVASGKIHRLSPTQVLDALTPARQSLESLTLRLSRLRIPASDLQAHWQPLLSQFSALTTLVLDEQAFCRHWLPLKKSGRKQDEATCITTFLPQTVSLLGIRLHHHFHAYSDIVHLGDQVVAGHFKSLRRVETEYLYDGREDKADEVAGEVEAYRTGLRRAFEGSGILVSADAVWRH